MCKLSPIEVKANRYAAERLRELRGDAARAKFGPLPGSNEGMLCSSEKGHTRLTIGKLAKFAQKLNVPLSTFILPDDDLGEGDAALDFQTARKKTEAWRKEPPESGCSPRGAFVAPTRRADTGTLDLEPSIAWIGARRAGGAHDLGEGRRDP